MGPNFQPLIEYAIFLISSSSTITFFASRCVSARKKTSAAAKGKRGNASAPQAQKALESRLSIYPNIREGGIDRLLRVEESKTGAVGSELGSEPESVDKETNNTTYDPEMRGAHVSGLIGLLPQIRTRKHLRRKRERTENPIIHLSIRGLLRVHWNELPRFILSFTPSLNPLTPRVLLVSLPVYDTHDIFSACSACMHV